MARPGVAAVSPPAGYPLALFGQLVQLEGHLFRTWRRRILCPNPICEQRRKMSGARGRRQVGRQTIRETLDPRDWSLGAGYRVDRVELGRDLIPLPDLPGGTLSFGLSESIRRTPPTPGVPVRTPLHRAVPVLQSVGAAHQVGRHASTRIHGGPGSYWSLALSGAAAARPFVVTCPDCRERCKIDGAPPEAELRRLTSIAQDALRK